ncbi:MAG TPA: alpha/beta hydrolase-fold protein [Microbacteriaceae bacterium]|nr:alpha/beta hydrolase-fold protein [Microbacteriaceae bacterium]
MGYAACWLTGDVWNLFDIDLTAVTRTWAALAFAGAAVAVTNFCPIRRRRASWLRMSVAGLAIPLFALVAAAGVNVNFGAYPTVADALGANPYRTITVAKIHHSVAPGGRPSAMRSPASWTDWRPSGPLPKSGKVGTVVIPARVPNFTPRPASIYLPPAAEAANAPALPVIVALSGQPGQPADMFVSGRMPAILNRYAAAHHGLAPIVVVPDQLGAPRRNPMCVNSPLGDVATYLTKDVPRWIRAHLHVAPSPGHWAVAGFSEGGTCSIQFAAGYPGLFHTFLDISGEEAPTMGPRTIAAAFHGSPAAYDAAKPLNLLAAHAPYRHTLGIFGVGAADARYLPQTKTVEAAARRAGMTTSLIVAPGTAHDWRTVRFVMTRALPRIANRLFDGLS